MSTISIYPAATQGGRRLGVERGSAVETISTENPEHSDAQMMYAWSIGITGAARTMQAPHEEIHEECPPEVYIG